MCWSIRGCALLLIFWSLRFQLSAQELSSQPGAGVKVCVAEINNYSSQSLAVARLRERLIRDLKDVKVEALALDSGTTSDRKLHPTVQNGNEMREKECDYLLLIQTTDQGANPSELEGPQISIGGRVPSIDSADSVGRQAGSQRREYVNVNFALFRPGNPKAVLDTRIPDGPSADVSDSLMLTMDRVANRVARDLKKK